MFERHVISLNGEILKGDGAVRRTAAVKKELFPVQRPLLLLQQFPECLRQRPFVESHGGDHVR